MKRRSTRLRHNPVLRIVPDTEERKQGRNEFRASIDGYQFGLSATEAALVSSLHRQLGQAIPYDRFSRIIHGDCTRWKGHVVAYSTSTFQMSGRIGFTTRT